MIDATNRVVAKVVTVTKHVPTPIAETVLPLSEQKLAPLLKAWLSAPLPESPEVSIVVEPPYTTGFDVATADSVACAALLTVKVCETLLAAAKVESPA